jgi:hypothetical protein
MRKLKNIAVIQVITKPVLGFLFFRARSNLMVAIIAIKAQIISLSVVSDLLFRDCRFKFVKYAASKGVDLLLGNFAIFGG